ncbi:MAG: hypothetical protein ACK4NS_03870 [Saprospiraceae bacterium]
MMRTLFFVLFLGASLFALPLMGQKFQFEVGLNGGGSYLWHQTRFEKTALFNQFSIIQKTYHNRNLTYTWKDFEDDFRLRHSFAQPRFGFTGLLSHSELPIAAVAEAMSSTSSFREMAYGVTLGLGKTYFDQDDLFFFSFLGGYKFVWDTGFGASTLTNSIGDNEIRSNMEAFFDPKKPIGSNRGQLFSIRLSAGRTLGETRLLSAGFEAYGELDLTGKTVRESRMNNVGAHIFLRYSLTRPSMAKLY